MRPRPGPAAVLAIALCVLSGTGIPARAADGRTRRALAELKALCDGGLVDAAVCLAKQRALLGLPDVVPPDTRAVDTPRAEVPTTPEAQRHVSPLGFQVDLPPGWRPVAPDAVRSGFATLRQQVDHGGATADLLDRIERQALDGTTDFFASGRDHVQVQRAPASPPTDPIALARFCERLEATASRAAGRPLSTQACGRRLIGGAPSLYVERDGLMPGTHTAQYWVPAPHGRAVIFVLSCARAQLEPCRRDFDALVASLTWP